MTTRDEAVAACLALPFSYKDYPFDDPNWTAIRHRENRRIFALIFQRDGVLWMNLKADPMWGDLWRRTYRAVAPAYHMNKQHWIGVALDGTMAREDILRLIRDSYGLTLPRKRGKSRPRPEE